MKEIVVAAGLCVPMRERIARTLAPYGVVHEARNGGWLDACGGPTIDPNFARVDTGVVLVRDQAAAWAEYLLLRSGRFRLLSSPLDPRNARWALQWGGAMPRPWVEAGCKLESLAEDRPLGVVAAGDRRERAGGLSAWLAGLAGSGSRQDRRRAARSTRRQRARR